ncbi:HAD-IB family hydrolase [Phenylobacterium sp.]|jgi:phosphatidylglycerophosphatase C|uniref:HAD-IB family hydrolase n=1 Tax=Phenylobacterium sp. TaxID=1871053 RepID=UPI002F42E713
MARPSPTAPDQRPIVAFDFDGTLTVADSFTAFLAWRAGRGRHLRGLAKLAPAVAGYLRDRDRGRLKAAAVHEFLKGAPRAVLEGEALAFARASAARLLRPDALATWRRWGAEGARRVIVTASPELTVAPFARDLGAEALIGTRLAFDAQDRVGGGFVGENCRGPEKVRRLREAFGPDVRLAAAYGDTSGDREMLAIADVRGFKVFKARP